MAMELDDRLYRLFEKPAAGVGVETLCLGLGYTAVATSDGGTGIAYTYLGAKTSCGVVKNYRDFEGQSALELLAYLHSADPLERTMALALVNALNHRAALALPDDPKNGALFDALGIGSGTRVAMVGFSGRSCGFSGTAAPSWRSSISTAVWGSRLNFCPNCAPGRTS
jgi:uncharacterized protein (DUF4213/DUF364 family)